MAQYVWSCVCTTCMRCSSQIAKPPIFGLCVNGPRKSPSVQGPEFNSSLMSPCFFTVYVPLYWIQFVVESWPNFLPRLSSSYCCSFSWISTSIFVSRISPVSLAPLLSPTRSQWWDFVRALISLIFKVFFKHVTVTFQRKFSLIFDFSVRWFSVYFFSPSPLDVRFFFRCAFV